MRTFCKAACCFLAKNAVFQRLGLLIQRKKQTGKFSVHNETGIHFFRVVQNTSVNFFFNLNAEHIFSPKANADRY